jgi:NH3-dependent NAD+ synthetase
MTTPSIDLSINTDLARDILTGFIHSEITRAGFSRAVVGLSGGLDSALSCVLAAQALAQITFGCSHAYIDLLLPIHSRMPDGYRYAGYPVDNHSNYRNG